MRISPLIVFTCALFMCAPARATMIEEVTSKGGIKAWLVEDHKLPLIAMHFAFRGGVEQDPQDRQGLATLTMSLMTEGAGSYDANAFQQQLADHSISLHFAAGRDDLSGGLKFLREERATGFDLLRVALTAPRFDDAAIARAKSRQLTGIRYQLGDPDWQARYALLSHIFAGHPYDRRSLGTEKTLAAITRADIQVFAADHLARDNLLIAVAGDITPVELGDALDQTFGKLSLKVKLAPVVEVIWPHDTPAILVPRDGTQTSLLFARPGPKRLDPDWYAAEIANYILGGGGFSSRLMHEVRDKNGLTYGISTDLAPMEHAAMIVGDAATDNPKTGKAWDITRAVWKNFFANGATPEEIQGAKDYLTGALPLAMTSTDAIAGVLVSMQEERLGRDYLDRYKSLIDGATAADVMNVIKRWFDPAQLTLVMVGKPEGITPSVTEPQVKE